MTLLIDLLLNPAIQALLKILVIVLGFVMTTGTVLTLM